MAEYTFFGDDDFIAITSAFGFPFEHAEPIKGGMANTSYLLNGEFVLTSLDNHDFQSAEKLVQVMKFLKKEGMVTPQPIKTKASDTILDYGGRPIILKPYLRTTSRPTSELERAEGVGQLLFKLHSIESPDFVNRFGRRIPANALQVVESNKCNDLKDAIQLVKEHTFEDMFAKFPLALCHGDLMGDNVLELEDGSLVAIDWETVTIDSIILDLGIAAVSAIKRNEPIEPFAQNLLNGYMSNHQAPTIDRSDVILATAYASVLMAYHRFVRQNITFPNPSKSMIYKELLPFVFNVL